MLECVPFQHHTRTFELGYDMALVLTDEVAGNRVASARPAELSLLFRVMDFVSLRRYNAQ